MQAVKLQYLSFFFNDTATTEIYTLSLHDALPIYNREISISRLAEMVKKMTKSSSKITYVPYDKAFEKGFEDMIRRVPDILKAKALIGFLPGIKLEDSLEDIITFYKK